MAKPLVPGRLANVKPIPNFKNISVLLFDIDLVFEIWNSDFSA